MEKVLQEASSHVDSDTMQKMRALVAEAQEKKRRTNLKESWDNAPVVQSPPKATPAPQPSPTGLRPPPKPPQVIPQRAPLPPVKVQTPPKPPPERPPAPSMAPRQTPPRPPAHAPPTGIADVTPELPVHVPPPPVSLSVQPPMPNVAFQPPGMRPYLDYSRSVYVPQHYDAYAHGYNPYAQMTPRPSTVPMTITVDVPMEHIPQYFQGMPYPSNSPPRSFGPYYNHR